MILDATGFYVAWVNGEPRGERSTARITSATLCAWPGPERVPLRGERGRFRARLTGPPAEVFFTDKDMTLPDLVVGDPESVWAGLRLSTRRGRGWRDRDRRSRGGAGAAG